MKYSHPTDVFLHSLRGLHLVSQVLCIQANSAHSGTAIPCMLQKWNTPQTFNPLRPGQHGWHGRLWIFLAATKQFYEWFSPSVCLSVRLSVCLSDVCLSVCLSDVTHFWLYSHHCIIMKFSGVITNDQGKIHANGQDHRSKVKVTEVITQLSRFQTLTPV